MAVNVWMGVSVETAKYASRIDDLRRTHARDPFSVSRAAARSPARSRSAGHPMGHRRRRVWPASAADATRSGRSTSATNAGARACRSSSSSGAARTRNARAVCSKGARGMRCLHCASQARGEMQQAAGDDERILAKLDAVSRTPSSRGRGRSPSLGCTSSYPRSPRCSRRRACRPRRWCRRSWCTRRRNRPGRCRRSSCSPHIRNPSAPRTGASRRPRPRNNPRRATRTERCSSRARRLFGTPRSSRPP